MVTVAPFIRRVVCAAVQHPSGMVMLLGPRHFDMTMRQQMMLYQHAGIPESSWQDATQGFIDQMGVFMDREEALKVVRAAGQIFRYCGNGERNTELYSENLY